MAERPAVTTRSRAPEAGFTLVEILVVLAILATLIGLVAAIIPRAMLAKQKARADMIVRNIGAELDRLQMSREDYGRYPPSRAWELRFGKNAIGKELGNPNDVNVGIECLYFFLNNPDIQANQVTADADLIGNTDNDHWKNARGNAADTDAREYLDPWGRPLVYIHSNDYKEPKGLDQIRASDGETIHVHAKRMPASAGGGFKNPNSFQLFSVGPNGKQDEDNAEDSDDIEYVGR